jgi:phosphoribosylaminoimidazolecarboxamide formyltransferase/IMP cyclohydrolase
VSDRELSPLATAYARARGADRVSSYGDWVALSDPVDTSTARLLRLEVSDGVIAPGYEPGALELLRGKRGGGYVVLEIDPGYAPPALETREVFGVAFEQPRNTELLQPDSLQRIPTRARALPEAAQRAMLVALVALKYAQSNSVVLVRDGQVIGLGAGQQSRIHCTRLAAAKADLWRLRQHPGVLELRFRPGIGRTERDNAIDQYLRGGLTPPEEALWRQAFEVVPSRLSEAEQRRWLAELDGVTLGSDAYIPFRDNIDRASQSGVRYVVQPGGAAREADIVRACDEYGMAMVLTGVRLFHH